MDLLFDLNKIPFTCYDSMLTVTRKEDTYFGFALDEKVPDGYYIHPVYDDERYLLQFRMFFEKSSSPLDMDYEFKPEKLTLSRHGENIAICYPDNSSMRFKGKTSGFILEYGDPRMYDCAYPVSENKIEINVYTKKVLLYCKKGNLILDAPWYEKEERSEYIRIIFRPDEDGEVDVVWQEYDRAWDNTVTDESFEQAVLKRKEEFSKWLENSMDTRDNRFKGLFRLANYLLWSNVVSNNGYVKDREIVYLSKNWMTASWTYDNLYFMIVFMEKMPSLAWDIYLSFIDYQDDMGALPDWICTHRVNNRFFKPPVMGSILNYMMDRMELDPGMLEKIYQPLIEQTEFWFKYHDFDGDGIPNYTHGNDAASDNSTVFDLMPTVECANLPAFLIIQEYAIARIARTLGKEKDAISWEKRAKELTDLFIEHNYDRKKKQFVSPVSGSHELASGDSLLNFMPIMLGDKLPQNIFDNLIEQINQPGRFKTEYGYASEGLDSPKYRKDSYWRGPVWEHQFILIVEGLLKAGRRDEAKEVADKLINLCLEHGFCENYDAHTGEGQRDLGYLFTAVVFMIFVKEFYS